MILHEQIKELKKEINDLEFKEFQKKILKQDQKYKEKLDKDNKNIKKFTLVLASGVLIQIYSEIHKIILEININILAIFIFNIFSLIVFFFFLIKSLDTLELRYKLFEEYKNKKTKSILGGIIFIIIIAIVLQIYYPELVTPVKEKTENQIYKDLKNQIEINNQLQINNTNLILKNQKIINCSIELEKNNKTEFKTCIK